MSEPSSSDGAGGLPPIADADGPAGSELPPWSGIGPDIAAATLVAAGAFLAAVFFGAELANVIRRGFGLLSPVRLLEFVAILGIAGIAMSLPPTDRPAAMALAVLRRRLAGRSPVGWRIPTVTSLTMIVAAATVFRAVLAPAKATPTFLGDELLYAELAKSFALYGQPLLRGSLDIGHSLLFPLFASPAYLIASNGVEAVAIVKAMDSLAMALAAVPTYLLASRVVSRGWGIGVAALVAFAPWTAYSAFFLTEPLFYLVFATFALVLVRMLEQPSWMRQLAMVGMLAVLVAVRPQALALVGSVILAILFWGVLERAVMRTFRSFLPSLVMLGFAAASALVASAVGLPIPTGGYRGLLTSSYGVLDIGKWILWNVGSFELGVGVVAVAAFPLALRELLRREGPRPKRAVGVAALALSAGILFSVAVLSASPFGYGILHERNLFYVTPLLLVCLASWLQSGLFRARWLTSAVVLAVIALPVTLPDRLVSRTNNVESITATALRSFESVVPGVPGRMWLGALALLGAIPFLLARRPFFPLSAVVVASLALVATTDYGGPLNPSQARGMAWIDTALPAGATATILHVGFPRDPSVPCDEVAQYEQQGLVVWTDFFNARVDRLAYIGLPVARDNLVAPEWIVGPGGLVLDHAHTVSPRYVAADSRQPIVGTRIRRFDLESLGSVFREGASLTLWEIDPPLRFLPRPGELPRRADGRNC